MDPSKRRQSVSVVALRVFTFLRPSEQSADVCQSMCNAALGVFWKARWEPL